MRLRGRKEWSKDELEVDREGAWQRMRTLYSRRMTRCLTRQNFRNLPHAGKAGSQGARTQV